MDSWFFVTVSGERVMSSLLARWNHRVYSIYATRTDLIVVTTLYLYRWPFDFKGVNQNQFKLCKTHVCWFHNHFLVAQFSTRFSSVTQVFITLARRRSLQHHIRSGKFLILILISFGFVLRRANAVGPIMSRSPSQLILGFQSEVLPGTTGHITATAAFSVHDVRDDVLTLR